MRTLPWRNSCAVDGMRGVYARAQTPVALAAALRRQLSSLRGIMHARASRCWRIRMKFMHQALVRDTALRPPSMSA